MRGIGNKRVLQSPLTSLGLLLGLMLGASCAKDKNSGPDPQVASWNAVGFDSMNVSCAGVMDCPEYVAQLGIRDGNRVGMCSATLISPNRILTNAHCIPESLKSAGSDCTDKIVAVFPAAGTKASQTFKCDRVILSHSPTSDNDDDSHEETDLAVITLTENVGRATVAPNFLEGFVSGQNVHAWVVDPTFSGRNGYGSLRRVDCTTDVDNFEVKPVSGEEGGISYETIIYGDDCEVISGNSGTGLFSETGALAGAIYAAYPVEEYKKFSNFQIDTYHGSAASIGCIPGVATSDFLLPNRDCREDSDGSHDVEHRERLLDRAFEEAEFANDFDLTAEDLRSFYESYKEEEFEDSLFSDSGKFEGSFDYTNKEEKVAYSIKLIFKNGFKLEVDIEDNREEAFGFGYDISSATVGSDDSGKSDTDEDDQLNVFAPKLMSEF